MIRISRWVMVFLFGVLLTAAVPTEASYAQSIRDWQVKVLKSIQSSQSYPRSALARKLEGAAKIRLSIDRSGMIKDFTVVNGTGHDVLDRQIPRLMKRIDPLPAPPDALPDKNLTFNLPVIWKLS